MNAVRSRPAASIGRTFARVSTFTDARARPVHHHADGQLQRCWRVNISFTDYLGKPFLVDDAYEIASRVEAGEFDAARGRLLILYHRCQKAGLSEVAASTGRAIQALEPQANRGALGAELFTLAGKIEDAIRHA